MRHHGVEAPPHLRGRLGFLCGPAAPRVGAGQQQLTTRDAPSLESQLSELGVGQILAAVRSSAVRTVGKQHIVWNTRSSVSTALYHKRRWLS